MSIFALSGFYGIFLERDHECLSGCSSMMDKCLDVLRVKLLSGGFYVGLLSLRLACRIFCSLQENVSFSFVVCRVCVFAVAWLSC